MLIVVVAVVVTSLCESLSSMCGLVLGVTAVTSLMSLFLVSLSDRSSILWLLICRISLCVLGLTCSSIVLLVPA